MYLLNLAGIICKIFYLGTNFIRKIKVPTEDPKFEVLYNTIEEFHPQKNSKFQISYQGININ